MQDPFPVYAMVGSDTLQMTSKTKEQLYPEYRLALPFTPKL